MLFCSQPARIRVRRASPRTATVFSFIPQVTSLRRPRFRNMLRFKTMHRYVFHNDRVLPINEVRLSPGQAGLLNGWGLFTTSRIYDGLPFAFERHWKRLSTDAGRINL